MSWRPHKWQLINILALVAACVPLAVYATPANQGEATTPANAWPFKLTDGTRNLTLLNSAPGSDTGQVAVPVRILSGLSLNVTGTLTDTQLRASPVPVSGTFWQTTQPVSGTFWQTTQPVSAASLPLPSGASTESTLALIKAKTDNLDVALSTRTKPADTQTVSGAVTANAGTGTFAVSGTVTANAGTGTMAVSGPLTDTQLRASAVPVSGTFYQATQPVSGTVTANAGSGTMAVSGTFWQATQPVSGTVTANAAQSGTWTVQPGNTANTTAWKVDGSAVTQPVSGTVASTESGTWTVQPGNTANSTPWLTTDSATSATGSAVPAKASYVGANVLALGAAPTAVSAGNLAGLAVDTQNRLLVNNFHPNLIACNLLTTNTTSTSLAGSCAAPGAAKSVYITDISIGGGVATSATAPAIIQTGTGGTCGTGTAILYRCNHGATGACEAHFSTPIKASANAEVCVLDGVTGTKSVTAQGFIAP